MSVTLMADEKMDDCPVHAVDELLKDGSATRPTTSGCDLAQDRIQMVGEPREVQGWAICRVTTERQVLGRLFC